MFKLTLALPLAACALLGAVWVAPALLRGVMRTNSTTDAGLSLKKAQTFKGYHKGFFSPDGRAVALLDKDHADVVELAGGRRLFRLAPAGGSFLGAAFSPDGGLLATAYQVAGRAGASEIKVSLSSVPGGREVRVLPVDDDDWRRVADDLSFSPDGRLLASNVGGVARLWDVASGREARAFAPPPDPPGVEPERVLLSPDGRWLAVQFKLQGGPRTYDAVHLWELATGRQTVLPTEVYQDLAFSSDGAWLAVSAIADKGLVGERSVVEVWDVRGGVRQRVIEVPRAWRGAYAVAFSPDAALLAVSGHRRFGLFDARTGALVAEATHAGSRLFGTETEQAYDLGHLAFSPDGGQLLTGGNDGTVKLWRVVRN